MASERLVRVTVAIAITVLVASGGLVALRPAAGAPPAVARAPAPATGSVPASSAASPSGSADGRALAIERTLAARGVPSAVVHLPNLAAERPGGHQPVAPSYPQGPAPMGISDLGVRNVSGTLEPYDYNTSSVRGSLTLTRAQSAYVDGDGPDTFGIQLNAVATNVTLFGVPGYSFWTQNFAIFTESNGSLSLGDNIWNFTQYPGNFTASSLYAYGPNGSPQAPVYYYALGPTLTVTYPFTLTLYLNASLVADRPAVYFNYSVTDGAGTVAGSFDRVVFNSTATVPVTAAPVPAFQVNGTGTNALGLPNDFEFVLVGTGNGDTTTFFAINGTMALSFWNATADRYEAVPAAFDAGSDTGETSNGLLPVYAAAAGSPVVDLEIGPSFVDGLWNVSYALDGARAFEAVITPQNAFLFVSPGAVLDNATAQWVPTLRLGASASDFVLPNLGSFTLELLLSDRTPIAYTVTTTVPAPNTTTALAETLAVNATLGSYTPLLAWGNAELGAIHQSGNGSAGNPYVLIHRNVGLLDPVFAQLNFLGFPVFAGVLLIDTTDYVRVLQVSTAVAYGPAEAATLQNFSYPATNNLQLEFWNVSHVAVENSTDLAGWFNPLFAFFPVGSVLFWGSSDNLVAGNLFTDQGVGLALYGGTNNTVWGNTFLEGATEAGLDYGVNVTGILEWESGDLIYNNYFAVPQPALTPTADAFSCEVVCEPASYTDRWNVSIEPASASVTDLGLTLTGSILRTWYQGGNYWSNYGTPADPLGVLPYNDSGRITHGGDYVPLYPSTVYTVTFVESGLVPGVTWGVSFLGVANATTGPEMVAYAANGSYAANVSAPSGYTGPGTVAVAVNGSNVTVPVAFTELFPVRVNESGLLERLAWNASFISLPAGPSVLVNSSANNLTAELPNGTYTFEPAARYYNANPVSAQFRVDGSGRTLLVQFSVVIVLLVSATGLPANTPWTLTVEQGGVFHNETGLGDTSLEFTALQLTPIAYVFTVSASDYGAFPSGGSGSGASVLSEAVIFHSTAGASTSVPWTWIAVAALAALAVAGFVLYALERRGRARPPKPIVPAAAPAAATPPPWSEEPGDTEKAEPYSRPK